MKGFWKGIATIYSSFSGTTYASTDILTLSDFKKRFDKSLSQQINNLINAMPDVSKHPRIDSAIKHIVSLASSGKRIRPYIAYLGYKLSGGKNEIFNALVAIELFHLFALIHDDIIDESDERHGVATMHIHCRKDIIPSKSEHIGNSQAILIGDLVFAWANDILFANTSLASISNVRKIWNEMIQEVVVGQMIDVDIMTRESVKDSDIELKNLLKTARYSFVHPLRIGSALAENSNQYEHFFKKFGESVGSAYQIQDDLLDIIGNSNITGKVTLQDVEDGQHTYMTQYIFDRGNNEDKETLKKSFGFPIDDNSRKELIQLFIKSGAVDSGKLIIKEKISTALQSIEDYKIPDPYKQSFIDIINLINARNS
jgi:geranylgeranyl diphosphate synthase type I